MSELKAINAYRLTTNTEDSDVYIHNDEFGCGGDLVECYLKSEADKVIAEKYAEIAELRMKICDQCQQEIYQRDEEIRRLKRALYKACANWAHIAVAFFSSYVTKDRWRWMERKCLAKAEEYK